MTILPTVCKAALFVLAILYANSRQQSIDVATVHVRLVSASGNDIGEPEIEVFESAEKKENIAGLFHHGSASGVPFGIYRLRAHASGHWSAEREVRVFQSDLWVVMQLELGMGKTEGGLRAFRLSGEVRETLKPTNIAWLRLVGLYSGVIMDCKTDDNGKFSLSGIPQGSYILTTLQDGAVLDIRTIKIPAEAPIIIKPTDAPSRSN
jgi:hypothetical protein